LRQLRRGKALEALTFLDSHDRLALDGHMLFEGFAHGPSSFIKFVQDTDRDRESLRRLRFLDQPKDFL
jgi:hypothetical protein